MVLAVNAPTHIVKRSGETVPFEYDKVQRAIGAALDAVGSLSFVNELTDRVVNIVATRYDIPHVEQVQDACELVLQSAGDFQAAKHFILYRADHAKKRSQQIPDEIKNLFDNDKVYFPTPIQEFQFYDKYSRFDYEKGRRETWSETVERSVSFLGELAHPYGGIDQQTYFRIHDSIRRMRAMPSMRLLAMAGPAARRDSTAIYNCSYLPVDSIDSFAENMHICMAGCGVGFSVESMYVDKLPPVAFQKQASTQYYPVEDTAEGWANALHYGLHAWFDGTDIGYDFSLIRPSGTPLRTKGGRASGHEPLARLLEFCRNKVLSRQGKRIRPIDAHDMMCAIGNAVVSGGVRRTAMISLFDEDDKDMLYSKSGDFERNDSQRWNANNSMVWATPRNQVQFMEQFMAMLQSERGEPGIFNRYDILNQIPTRRSNAHMFGSNPCGEIILRPYGFCNLSIAVARKDDTFESMKDKVEVATIIGVVQSLATNFPNLRPIWKKNCEEERLLGVDITGQMDAYTLLRDRQVMARLKAHAVLTADLWSRRLAIEMPAAITTCKPSGNSSQLLDCSSGLHTRWAPYYVRNVRVSASSSMAKVLAESGVLLTPENGDDPVNPRTYVVSFPMRSPEGSIVRNDMSVLDQCEWWLHNKMNWTEHNPSVTITYKPNEVLDLAMWIWDNRHRIGGMAYLPRFEAKYDQLPYIEISAAEYERRVREFPDIDFSLLFKYDNNKDVTTAAQEAACLAGVCEVEYVAQVPER